MLFFKEGHFINDEFEIPFNAERAPHIVNKA
jgi:hypothetical protein